jgi:NADPH-dependent 2,4-dienoyl-CoA reductase/sulfur reductase-like enzyme
MTKNCKISVFICFILIFSMLAGCTQPNNTGDDANESNQQNVEDPSDEAPEEAKDITTDVVVVGGGGSGLTATINVKYGNKDVILVEKMPRW